MWFCTKQQSVEQHPPAPSSSAPALKVATPSSSTKARSAVKRSRWKAALRRLLPCTHTSMSCQQCSGGHEPSGEREFSA